MKTSFPPRSNPWLRALLWASLLPWALLPARADAPRIQSIRVETDALVIAADVPAGTRRLLLEGSSRGDLKGWIPRASWVAGPGATQAVFRVPRSQAMELYRVRADAALPVDPALFRGTNRFEGRVVAEQATGWMTPFDAAGGPPGGNPSAGAGMNERFAPEREVAESDIWRVSGDRLYFFNPHRGLQVVDITNPGAPAVLDTLPLAGAGEQMYLLGDSHVLLLLRPPCGIWGGPTEAAVVVVDVRGDRAAEVARVPVPGHIVESRLVGAALYLAAQDYRVAADRWENVLRVQPVDFADPAAPVVRPGLEFPGWPTALQATSELLLLAEQEDWSRTRVRVVDISDPRGAVRERAALPVPGRVADKFKLHAQGDIVSVIAESWSPRLVTTLRTFRLRAGGGHEALGRLEVGHGESLFGTRFDGDRAYIVTFLRVDPLWIIDLSDPAHPRVAGELEIPGWSNHLHPLGDRLLTVGIDDVNGWRAAVQLFDVGDPARPKLLAKAPLGERWSWSEANSDEKALAVLAEEGLVLLPFLGDGDQGVQIMDLGRDTLTPRGVIRGGVVPRRSALHRGRVLTISARELLAVNVADRDRPQVEARLELAYPVDRVVLAEGFLLEFSGAELRVRDAQAGSPVLNQVPLAEAPVLGAWRQGARLHVLQGFGRQQEWIPGEEPGAWTWREKPGRLVHRIYDLAALPALTPLGEATAATEAQFGGDFAALEPLPGLVVWAGGGWTGHFSPWGWGRPGMVLPDAVWGGGRLLPPWFGGWGGPVWHLAVDVSEPSQPAFRSQESTPSQGGGASASLTPAPGLVYFSTVLHESEVVGTNSWVWWVEAPGSPPGKDLIPVTNHWPVLRWTEKHRLHVLDYHPGADRPARRMPAELPGPLAAADREGHLLLVSELRQPPAAPANPEHWVHSLAYDGVSAFLADSAGPEVLEPGAGVVARGHGARLLAAHGAGGIFEPGKTPGGRLDVWSADAHGRLRLDGRHKLAAAASGLAAQGSLGLVRTWLGITLVDLRPAGGMLLREHPTDGCQYLQLERGDGTPAAGAWLPGGELGAFHLAP